MCLDLVVHQHVLKLIDAELHPKVLYVYWQGNLMLKTMVSTPTKVTS